MGRFRAPEAGFKRMWRVGVRHLPGAARRRHRRASEQLSRCLAAVTSGGGLIDAVSDLTQDRFVAFSSGLEKLFARAAELVAECELLLVLASGREDGQAILDSTLDLLSQPLDFIFSWSAEADSLIGRLRRALEAVEKLAPVENEVRRTLAPLRYIHTLLGVETAKMSPEFQAIFLKVREDIEMLQRRMDAAFEQQFEAVATIRRELGIMVAEIASDAAEQRGVVEKKREAIAAAIARSKEDIASSHKLGSSLARVAHEVSEEVSRIVVAIQSQDIVAQKLAHIRGAIGPLVALGRTLSRDGAGSPETALQLEQVSRVQIAQTESAGVDIEQARGAMGSAVSSVIERITELDQECLALRDFKNVSAGVRGIVQLLLDTTAEVRAMVKGAANASGRAAIKVQPLAELASNLTGSMDLVAHSMRMIALNAQVQAVRLGQGTGVEVLSAEAARISEETSRECEAALSEITAISEFLKNDLTGFSDLRTRAQGLDRRLTIEGEASDRKLHHYRDATLASFARVGDLAAKTLEEANAMLALLDFDQTAGKQIAALRVLFVDVEAAAAQCLATVDRETISSAAKSLEHNYTMHTERAVHAEALGRATEERESAALDPASAASVENGELELF